MRDITPEPMRQSEELENESEMTLELFGLVLKVAEKPVLSRSTNLESKLIEFFVLLKF